MIDTYQEWLDKNYSLVQELRAAVEGKPNASEEFGDALTVAYLEYVDSCVGRKSGFKRPMAWLITTVIVVSILTWVSYGF